VLAKHHDYANRKLEAEEELTAQRANGSRIPYVIFRLPDVLGPRDTTYRFFIYQLWARLAAGPNPRAPPLAVPRFLVDYNVSFVYVDDVARAIADVIKMASSEAERDVVIDQVFNLAWPQNLTITKLLNDIIANLRLPEPLEVKVDEEGTSTYLYPTVRRGPIDPTKAMRVLGWTPTPWDEAIRETVDFYEGVMKGEKYLIQRDEIVQVLSGQLYKNMEDKNSMYGVLEKAYGINLTHFKPRDEL
jgi:nucleoside-diphosphate-sugar epimerase